MVLRTRAQHPAPIDASASHRRTAPTSLPTARQAFCQVTRSTTKRNAFRIIGCSLTITSASRRVSSRSRHGRASGVHRPYIIHYVQGHGHLLHPSPTDPAKPPLENTMRRGPHGAMMRADSGCDSPLPEGELHQLSGYYPELDND